MRMIYLVVNDYRGVVLTTYIQHNQFVKKMTTKVLSRFQKCMKAYPSLQAFWP